MLNNTLKPEVIVIPPTKALNKENQIRTAAYARVSSDLEDQKNSFMTQMDYYTKYISENPDMIYVDLYADEGITGTRADKRDEFNRMIKDCNAGKIDLILTKSVSRFARNTLDGLRALREIKAAGANIVFEENDIDTRRMISEAELITAYSIAQEESISTSKNIKMGVRFRMRNGTFKQGQAPYGYKVVDGVFYIIKEEAEIVLLIFNAYNEGKSTRKIADELTEMSIPAPSGATKWHHTYVKYMLTNVRYKGDALLQKTYSDGFPFKSVKNKGELDMYYIKNANEPIVSEELFDSVNRLMDEKRERYNKTKYAGVADNTLRKKIYCGECGYVYGYKIINDTAYWICRNHNTSSEKCPSVQISESKVHSAFVQIYNRLVKNKDYILGTMLDHLKYMKEVNKNSKKEIKDINKEMAFLTEQGLQIERLNSRGYLESALYYEKKDRINAQIIELKTERKKLDKADECDKIVQATEMMIREIEASGAIDSFNKDIFEKFVKKIIANSQQLTFEMINGMNIKIDME